MAHGLPTPFRRHKPDDERERRERRSPFDGRADPERDAGQPEPLPVREREPDREQRRRHEVELELPRVGVERPERDKGGQPGRPSCAERPDRADGRELEGDHQPGVRRPRRSPADPRLEGEQRDGARRILGARVVAVQQRLPLRPEDDDVVVDRDPLREMHADEGRLQPAADDEQGQEPEPLLRAPGEEQRRRGDERLRDQPDVVALARVDAPEVEEHDERRSDAERPVGITREPRARQRRRSARICS